MWGHNQIVLTLDFGGRTLASGSEDGVVHVWRRIASGGRGIRKWRQWQTLRGHDGPVQAITWDSSGKLLSSGGQDARIIFWDMPTGNPRKVLQVGESSINSPSFSPTGSLLTTGSGTVRTEPSPVAGDWDTDMPDNPLATGTGNGITVWDVEREIVVDQQTAPSWAVKTVCFHPK
jgi:WD40 repeat protein